MGQSERIREIVYGKQFKKDINKKSNSKYLVTNEWAEIKCYRPSIKTMH